MLCIGEVRIGSNIDLIQKDLENNFGLKVPIFTIHTVLDRLETQGLIVTESARYSKYPNHENKCIPDTLKIHKLAPVILSVIEEERLAIDTKSLRDLLKKSQNINLDIQQLQFVLDRLVESKYLASTGIVHILTSEGVKYYEDTLNVRDKFSTQVNELYLV